MVEEYNLDEQRHVDDVRTHLVNLLDANPDNKGDFDLDHEIARDFYTSVMSVGNRWGNSKEDLLTDKHLFDDWLAEVSTLTLAKGVDNVSDKIDSRVFIGSVYHKVLDNQLNREHVMAPNFDKLRDLTIDIDEYATFEDFTEDDYSNYVDERVQRDVDALIDELGDDATYAGQTPEEIYDNISEEREDILYGYVMDTTFIQSEVERLPAMRAEQKRLAEIFKSELGLDPDMPVGDVALTELPDYYYESNRTHAEILNDRFEQEYAVGIDVGSKYGLKQETEAKLDDYPIFDELSSISPSSLKISEDFESVGDYLTETYVDFLKDFATTSDEEYHSNEVFTKDFYETVVRVGSRWEIDENDFVDNPDYFTDWLTVVSHDIFEEVPLDIDHDLIDYRDLVNESFGDMDSEDVKSFISGFEDKYHVPIDLSSLSVGEVFDFQEDKLSVLSVEDKGVINPHLLDDSGQLKPDIDDVPYGVAHIIDSDYKLSAILNFRDRELAMMDEVDWDKLSLQDFLLDGEATINDFVRNKNADGPIDDKLEIDEDDLAF